MIKGNKKFLIVLSIAVCLFVLLFTYLSLLGENDRAGNVIDQFFSSIHDHNYPQTLENLSHDLKSDIGADREQFYELCFLLELTLLKEYDLLDRKDYLLETRKEVLWIPFLHKATIPVSVLLYEKKPKDVADLFRKPDARHFIDSLFTVVREDGVWKIKSINYAESSIGESYINLKREVRLDEYLQKTPKGFQISPLVVKTEGMTPIENRRLSFIIHKVLRYLGEDGTSTTSDSSGIPLY